MQYCIFLALRNTLKLRRVFYLHVTLPVVVESLHGFDVIDFSVP